MPKGWVWCRIGELGEVVTGTTPSKGDASNYGNDFPFYKPTDLDSGINTSVASDNLSADGYEKARKLPINSVLVTCIGATIGKTGLIRRSGSCNQQINAIIPQPYVKPEYLYYCCVSEYGQDAIISNASATTLPILNKSKFSEICFPLPPIAEQQRILKAIHHYLEIIEGIDDKGIELLKLVQSSKSKTLDLAIHGKLVSQDPSDEPAVELLKRINPAFKPSHNLHYEGDLPNGWCLTQLKDVAVYGDTSNIDVSTINPDRWILELEDIEKDTARIIDIKTKADREVSGVRHSFKKGQILYSKLRTYLNKVLIAPDDGFCTTEIVPVTACRAILPDYLLMVMRSPYFLEYSASCGHGVKMPRLGTIDAQKAVVPLPPLAEQARIVEKISVLMTALSSL